MRRGAGAPFVMRGAASGMPAMRRWATDAKLAELHGSLPVPTPRPALMSARRRASLSLPSLLAPSVPLPAGQVEFEVGKKETRQGVGDRASMRSFLARYEAEDIYAVSQANMGATEAKRGGGGRPTMRADVELLPFLRCGGATAMLDEAPPPASCPPSAPS